MHNKHVLVFGASNSRHSINKQLAVYAASQLEGGTREILDLNDFALPIYSVDLERSSGIPAHALRFAARIEKCDALIMSIAEHNGLFSTAFKNLWDWMSRIGSPQIWKGKPMLLLCASPGKRPEKYVMQVAKDLFPHYGGNIIADFYLPGFNETFAAGQIVDAATYAKFDSALSTFQTYLLNH